MELNFIKSNKKSWSHKSVFHWWKTVDNCCSGICKLKINKNEDGATLITATVHIKLKNWIMCEMQYYEIY